MSNPSLQKAAEEYAAALNKLVDLQAQHKRSLRLAEDISEAARSASNELRRAELKLQEAASSTAAAS